MSIEIFKYPNSTIKLMEITKNKIIIIATILILFCVGLAFFSYVCGKSDMAIIAYNCVQDCVNSIGDVKGICFMDCMP